MLYFTDNSDEVGVSFTASDDPILVVLADFMQGRSVNTERRSDWSAPFNYLGTAAEGTLESDPKWDITRIEVNLDGTTISLTAVGSWNNRTTLVYI